MSAVSAGVKRLVTTQDDSREAFMADQFGLIRINQNRQDLDSIDRLGNRWEMKSTTKKGGSYSTTRDLGPRHLKKWRFNYFLFGRAWNYASGFEFENYYMLAPVHMEAWYQKIEAGFNEATDFCNSIIADLPHRSPEDHERIRRSMYDGMLLNDPNISRKYIEQHGERVVRVGHDTILDFAERFPIAGLKLETIEVDVSGDIQILPMKFPNV